MRVGNLAGNVAGRRYGQHQFYKQPHKGYENNAADKVKHYMRQRYPFGSNIGTQRSKHRRNAGADIIAQKYGNCAFQRNKTLIGNGN